MRQRILRAARLGIPLLALLLPILPRLCAGLDLPQHIAVTEICARLVRGDPATHALFAFHIQPLGYHLFYLVSTLLSLAIGSAWATRLVLFMAGAWLVVAVHDRLRTGAARALCMPVALVYSGYLWREGFVPNVVACAFAGLVLIELSHPSRVGWARPTMYGVVAALTHAMAWPAVAISASMALVMRVGRWQRAAATLAATSAVALPGIVWVAAYEHHEASATNHQMTFDNVELAIRRIGLFLTDADVPLIGVAQVGVAMLVVLLATSALQRRATLAAHERRVLWMQLGVALGCLSLLWLAPSSTPGRFSSSYEAQLRCLPQAQLALLLMGQHSPIWQGRLRAALISCCGGLTLAHGVALLVLALQLGRMLEPWPEHMLPPHARVVSVNELPRTFVPPSPPPSPIHWPAPLRPLFAPRPGGAHVMHSQNAALWAIDAGALWVDNIFEGGHMPVALRAREAFVRGAQRGSELVVRWQHRGEQTRIDHDAAAWVAEAWRHFDVLFVQGPTLSQWLWAAEGEARMLGRGAGWVALAAPEPENRATR